MRTTVDLSPDLLAEVKAFAQAQGSTLSSVLENAAREALARHAGHGEVAAVSLPVSGDLDATPLVDILDKDALAAALEDDRP
jgi:hypothetical protein